MTDTGSRLRRQLESASFDPQNYVKQLSQHSDGDRDLQEHRQKIQTLADETAQNLKKNVYKNYRQFIDMAKEIPYVESEMYQLSHILTEQKSIMESITQALLLTDKDLMSKEMVATSPKETDERKHRTLASSPALPEVSTNPYHVDEGERCDADESAVDVSLEWLQELPEDLDICIAQRDFEDAVDLLEKFNEHLRKQPVTPRVKELLAKVEERVRQLTEVLVFDLSPGRSLRGGPKATRRAVSQLIRLGQSTKACQLFLKNRTAAVHTAIRQLRIQDAALLYIHKLCNVFFTSLLETAKEFQVGFAGNTGCYSAFAVWSQSAMKMFVDTFSKQVFDNKESLSTATECMKVAMEHCRQLNDIGLDLTFSLQSLLVKDVKAALHSYRDIIIKATKHRNSKEMWRRMNIMTPEALAKLKEEMHSCGMDTFEQYTGDCRVNLSYTVVAFTKQMMSFLVEGLKLYLPELHTVLLESLREIILVAVQHVDDSLRCEQDAQKKAFIRQNFTFLHDTALAVVERRFEEGVGKSTKQLQDLRRQEHQAG